MYPREAEFFHIGSLIANLSAHFLPQLISAHLLSPQIIDQTYHDLYSIIRKDTMKREFDTMGDPGPEDQALQQLQPISKRSKYDVTEEGVASDLKMPSSGRYIDFALSDAMSKNSGK